MKSVILIHGKNADPTMKWYPWLQDEMDSRGISCRIPAFPDADEPRLGAWIKVIDGLSPDEDTILIGHSRGGVAALRWLEAQPEHIQIAKCILIATNSGLNAHRYMKEETNHGFYTDDGYDFDKIKSHCKDFHVIHSTDDPWVPYAQGVENAEGLGVRLHSYENLQHFGTGVDEVPDLVGVIARG